MEELDLSNSKWTPESEIYLLSVTEGIRENYPNIDLEKELKELEYTIEDLLETKKIMIFMAKLHEKYPD
jgi:hypothetical protein